jgi:hypothetical protein
MSPWARTAGRPEAGSGRGGGGGGGEEAGREGGGGGEEAGSRGGAAHRRRSEASQQRQRTIVAAAAAARAAAQQQRAPAASSSQRAPRLHCCCCCHVSQSVMSRHIPYPTADARTVFSAVIGSLNERSRNQSNQQNVWRLCKTSKMSWVCAKPGFCLHDGARGVNFRR